VIDSQSDVSEESGNRPFDRLGALQRGLRLLGLPLAVGRVAVTTGLGIVFTHPSSEHRAPPASVSIYSDEIESSLERRSSHFGKL
jgi:hypothetical protein